MAAASEPDSLSAASAPTLVAVVSRCSWTLYNFRRSLMRAIAGHGHEVVALGSGGDGFDLRLLEEGFPFEVAPVSRRGLDPIGDLRLLFYLVRTFRRRRPAIVHSFTIKPAIFATLAASIARVPVRVVTITGLGHAFTTARPMMRRAVEWLYRRALARADVVFFQNDDDRDLFVSRGLVAAEKIRQVAGSGVDLERFQPAPLPTSSGAPPVFLMIARLLREKGVREYVEAARLVKRTSPEVRFVLAGGPDPRNPSALSEAEISALRQSGAVEWLGEVEDVRSYIAAADIVVLPSYREGLPRSLLEGAAMGRALIATDVPGCREIVEHGATGYLVPAADAHGLAEAMRRFISQPGNISIVADRARSRVMERFDERHVLHATLEAYGWALANKRHRRH